MVGCGDHGKGLSDSLNKLKLQPLMKRPKTTTYSTMPSPYCSFILKTDHPVYVAIPSDGQRKREINTEPVVSSRWNPTREQIYALEEMYRGGTRTPTAEQIQQIVAKLRRFGKIEGKNVFYWFQNHKARERQKRRRQLESSCGELGDIRNLGEKRSVLSRTGFEADKKKKWATPSNCSTISEESVSIHREVVAEKGIQVEGKDNVTGCEDESRECQTLQLFPLWSDIGGDGNIVNVGKNDGEVAVRNITTKFTPIKFFEFLPLKS